MRTVVLATLVLCAACDAGPQPVHFDDYAVEAQAALCAWAVGCRQVPDDATCRRLLDPKRYDDRRAADGIRLGRLRYDPEAAGRCLAAGRAAACPSAAFADPSCAQVFTGLVPEGGACTTAYDCAGGDTCAGPICDRGCCVGACAAPDPAPPPAPLATPGQPCASHADCVDTAYCEVDGRCTPLPHRAGEHCLYGCWYGDLYCDIESETCHPFARLGEPCSPAVRCNAAYAFCDGVCRPRPGAGEPCDDAVRRCVGGARCVAGVCAARGGAGDACASDDDCEVGCDLVAGACAAYSVCR